eukprot:jgi/Botrbrau1/6061/Bobra.177_1s0001.1
MLPSFTACVGRRPGRATGSVLRRGQLSDLEVIVQNNIAMAKETEDIDLTEDIVRQGVRAVLEDPHKGYYLVSEVKPS